VQIVGQFLYIHTFARKNEKNKNENKIYMFIYLQLTSIFGEVEGNEDGKYKGQGFLQNFFPYLLTP